MGMFYDRNAYIVIKIASMRQDLKLIPDTGMNEITLVNGKCPSCATPAAGKWNPSNDTAKEQTEFNGTVDYFYTSHLFETQIQGRHYEEGMCIMSDKAKCSRGFSMFAIEDASPMLYSLADGYMGLGVGKAYGETGSESLNALDQLIKHNLID